MSPKNISIFISSLTISLLLLVPAKAAAQFGNKKPRLVTAPDTVPLFNGLAVSVDLLGAGMKFFGDYGQYEGALRVNLRDKYFPIVEIGVGQTETTDVATRTFYKTSAPYVKLGADYNLLKNKHDIYRLYGGARYGFTNFKFDLTNPGIHDPVWGGLVDYSARDVKSHYHWLEIVFGVDATIAGPLHLGWSVRYRNRLFHSTGEMDNAWYVPGYGKAGKSVIGGTFNIIFEL